MRIVDLRARTCSIAIEAPTRHSYASPGFYSRTILELMAKGSYFGINLATADLDGTFAKLEANGAEVVQEPTEQPYGVRDCAFRDPAGNLLRIQELR